MSNVATPLVLTSLDNGSSTDVVFVNFKKAFDTIPHSELLYKLWSPSITCPLWFWFKDYLSHCLHYVCINGTSSSYLPVLSGIPQGSVLGLLLFLIYINDIPNAPRFIYLLMTQNSHDP